MQPRNEKATYGDPHSWSLYGAGDENLKNGKAPDESMESVSRLAFSFSQSLTLGRKKKPKSPAAVRPEKVSAPELPDLSSLRLPEERDDADLPAPPAVKSYRRDEQGRLHFLLGDRAGGEECIESRAALGMWPAEVLDFYLANLSFGGEGSEPDGGPLPPPVGPGDCDDDAAATSYRPTAAVRGLRCADSERTELQLIDRLLRVGRDRLASSDLPSAVNGLIRYTPGGGHVLAFVEFRAAPDGVPEEALLPLCVCRSHCPLELLDFLHTTIHLGDG